MSTVNYTLKYRKNGELIISSSEALALYFYGINLDLASDGTVLSDEIVEFYIRAAQEEFERFFDIKLKPQLVTEKRTYHRDDYMSNNFPSVQTSFPVKEGLFIAGLLNDVEQIYYPQEWINWQESSDEMYSRMINLVPTGSTLTSDTNVIVMGIMNQIGFQSFRQVPNYWTVQYISGFDSIHYDILNIIGKSAAIGLFNVFGDIILGQPALANYSVSLDGLSQSIGTTNSATNAAFGARIINYQKEIKISVERLKRIYKGITFTAL